MYADDTVLYVHGKDPEQISAKLTSTMENVTELVSYSYLTLNVENTVTMYFLSRQKQRVL